MISKCNTKDLALNKHLPKGSWKKYIYYFWHSRKVFRPIVWRSRVQIPDGDTTKLAMLSGWEG